MKEGIERDSFIIVSDSTIFLRMVINSYGKHHPSFSVVTPTVKSDGLVLYGDTAHLLKTAIDTVQSFGQTAYLSKDSGGRQWVKLANVINDEELELVVSRFFKILSQDLEVQVEISHQ
ncbi:hypothetical protein AB3X91_07425 [Paraburkholderia sp. BR14263]|uniref:hypothetical protein n=1 Tax=unclassified Paraburkholderia TaxID=2615204 RepID=UPI0034CF34F1